MLWCVFQVFWNTVVDVFMVVATVLFLEDTENPLKGPPGCEFTPRRIVYRAVSLDDIKLVKNALNAVSSPCLLSVSDHQLFYKLENFEPNAVMIESSIFYYK